MVDLDGAKHGQPANLEHLRRIAGELRVPVQYGGGLRTLEAIERALEAGAQRAILGTAAFTDPRLLDAALVRRPRRIVVSLDVRGGRSRPPAGRRAPAGRVRGDRGAHGARSR